jgi:hypothetical protein
MDRSRHCDLAFATIRAHLETVLFVFGLNEPEEHYVLRELKNHVVLRCRAIEDVGVWKSQAKRAADRA